MAYKETIGRLSDAMLDCRILLLAGDMGDTDMNVSIRAVKNMPFTTVTIVGKEDGNERFLVNGAELKLVNGRLVGEWPISVETMCLPYRVHVHYRLTPSGLAISDTYYVTVAGEHKVNNRKKWIDLVDKHFTGKTDDEILTALTALLGKE